jgi:hypothetical protein
MASGQERIRVGGQPFFAVRPTFVVHVLAAGDPAVAERFSEVRPPIRSPFERLEVAQTPWGPTG